MVQVSKHENLDGLWCVLVPSIEALHGIVTLCLNTDCFLTTLHFLLYYVNEQVKGESELLNKFLSNNGDTDDRITSKDFNVDGNIIRFLEVK